MASLGMKSENIAHFNNKLIVNLLLQEPLSCVELAEKTNLTHMATGRILRRLSEMDIIKPYVEPPKKRSRGRQFFRYEINAERAYFVCIKFQHFNESFTVYDLSGAVVHSENFESKWVDNDVIDKLVARIKDVFSQRGLPQDKIAVFSVAIPGRVNDQTGEIIVSSKIKAGVNIKERLKGAFPTADVEVRNDIDYACLNSILSDEFDYSNGTHLYLYIGYGVACCVVLDNRIIHEASGFGGEIGMNTLDAEGNRLHGAVAPFEMQKYVRQVTKNENLSLSMLEQACGAYPEVKEKLIFVAKTLGRTICNYVDVIGATHIVFAGEITQYPKFFFDKFLEELKNTNYSSGLEYKIDFSFAEETSEGQMLLARLNSLDWVMEQY